MEHINLLRKIAWSFHNNTRLDFDDLFQEAYLAYVYAIDHYDPDKGTSITSFLWIHISNQLNTYVAKQKKINDPLVDIEYILYTLVSPSDSFFEALSDDAREIADLILATTKKFIKLKKEDAKWRVIRIMKNRGWSYTRTYHALNTLMMVCSNP